MAQIWNLITANGLEVWVGNRRNKKTRRFPEQDQDGFVWLNDRPYVHDPSRDIPETYTDRRLMGICLLGSIIAGTMLAAVFGTIAFGVTFMAGIILAGIIGQIKHEDMNSYWRDNEPDQINLSDKKLTPGSIGMTGDYIREFGKAEHIRQALNTESNWLVFLAIMLGVLGVISIIAAIAITYKPG